MLKRYNNETGIKLMDWLKNWAYFAYFEHELYYYVKLLVWVAYLNDFEALKLVLEIFDFFSCGDELRARNPFLRILDREEIGTEIKDILKKYCLE